MVLGADARNIEAVRRVFVIKGRPANHPLIVHLAECPDGDVPLHSVISLYPADGAVSVRPSK